MDGAPVQLRNEETILETPNPVDSTQPPISCEGEGVVEGDAMEEDVWEYEITIRGRKALE